MKIDMKNSGWNQRNKKIICCFAGTCGSGSSHALFLTQAMPSGISSVIKQYD